MAGWMKKGWPHLSRNEPGTGCGSSPDRPPIHPTNQPTVKNAVCEQALAVYQPGMSRRQLAEAAGLTQYQAWKLLREIQALNPHEPA